MFKNKKAVIISIIVLVLCLAGAFFAHHYLASTPIEGSKTITIVIYHLSGENKTLTITSDAYYLSEAMEQEKLIEGTAGQYGLYVTTVDGEAADENKQQWWGYTKSGEYVDTGIDQTIIEDGDSFEFTLNEGW